MYSLLSALTGFSSSKDELVWRLWILNLSLCLISVPDLYHLKATFGASSTSQSNLAALPTFISRGLIFCLNTGGTVVRKKKKKDLVNEQNENEMSEVVRMKGGMYNNGWRESRFCSREDN